MSTESVRQSGLTVATSGDEKVGQIDNLLFVFRS